MYRVYKEELDKYKESVDKGELIELDIMNEEDMLWRRMEVKVFRNPVEGGEEAVVEGPFGQISLSEKYYLKIEKIKEEEEE